MPIHPYNTTLEYSINGGGAYTELTGVRSINVAGVEIGKTQTTHLKSTGATHTYTPSWKTPKDITFTLEANATNLPAIHTTLGLMLPTDTIQKLRITLPVQSGQTTGEIYVYDGFISDWNVDEAGVDGDDDFEISVTFTVSGLASITAPT